MLDRRNVFRQLLRARIAPRAENAGAGKRQICCPRSTIIAGSDPPAGNQSCKERDMTTLGTRPKQRHGRIRVIGSMFVAALFCGCVRSKAADDSRVVLNAEHYQPSCGIEVSQHESIIQVCWPLDAVRRGRLTFDLTRDRPLIRAVAVSPNGSAGFRMIATGLDPVILLRDGKPRSR